MQFAILAVLVLIAVLIAPWLLAVLAAAAAVYGVFLIGASVIAVILGIVALLWVLIFQKSSRDDEAPPIVGSRKVCSSCQAEMPAAASKCPNCGAIA